MIQNTQDTYLKQKKIQDTDYKAIWRKMLLKKKVITRAPLASLRELKINFHFFAVTMEKVAVSYFSRTKGKPLGPRKI